MLKQQELNKIFKGDKLLAFLLVKKLEIKASKTGKDYLFLELGDRTTSVTGFMWDNFVTPAQSIYTGDIVKVEASVEEYNGSLNLKVLKLRKAVETDEVSMIDFQPVSKNNPAEMYDILMGRIEKMSNIYLKNLLNNLLAGEEGEKFTAAPAAKQWHHSYIHGLLEHTNEIIKICDLMCDIHPEIHRDLLISGAVLHDFGKIEELSYKSNFEYTDRGKLLGHIVICTLRVNEEAAKIEAFPAELKDCLMHLILSHHGKLEFASPVVPKTLEAITLSYADELSAKVNAYKKSLENELKGDAKWTKFINLAATELYKPGLME